MNPRPGVTPEDLPALRAAHADKANARLVAQWKSAERRLNKLRRLMLTLGVTLIQKSYPDPRWALKVTGIELIDYVDRFDGRRKGARK